MQREITVRSMTSSDIDGAAAALARAFYDDPLTVWLLPDDEKRMRQFFTMFTLMLRRSEKSGFYEAFTTDDHAGLAMWARPGAWDPPVRMVLPLVPRLVPLLGPRSLVRYLSLMQKL